MTKQLFNRFVSFLKETGLSVKEIQMICGAEFPRDVRNILFEDRSAFSFDGQNLQFVDSKINLQAFINITRGSGGFRLYPGLDKTESPKIFLMLGSAKYSDDPNEVTKYFLFRETDYNVNNLPKLEEASVAKAFLKSYYDFIKIETHPQSEIINPKKSRFYFSAEIDNYIRDLPLPLQNYYIKLEIGYITQTSNDNFAVTNSTEFPDGLSATEISKYHVGYTCMLTVHDYATNTPIAKLLTSDTRALRNADH
ncbi:MAG: hypothetical protein IPJ79_01155 [Bacteroidetes bacterium]|nr:hypothetical protein [Bacteroidota bacterium]